MSETYVQRMRVTFATDDSVKYVGHLDMARAWERAIRRARLPLAYSQGFNPQPRLHFAAALPVGFTAEAELVDVFLNEELDPADFLARLGPALPAGIRLIAARPVPREWPALQAVVCGARYRIEVETDEPDAAFADRLAGFMARPTAWRERRRGQTISRYDLRPLIESLIYTGPCELGQSFEADVRIEPAATGRPDELLAELGYETALRRIIRLEIKLDTERGRNPCV
ncbi:MAG: TIGR03936 family radical SAM-associated protein [Anaerolineae bacterium]